MLASIFSGYFYGMGSDLWQLTKTRFDFSFFLNPFWYVSVPIGIVGIMLLIWGIALFKNDKLNFRSGVVHEILGIMQNISTRQNYFDVSYSHWASRTGKSKENLLGHEDYGLLKDLYDRFQERNDYFRPRQSFSWPEMEGLNRSCIDAFSNVVDGVLWVKKAVPQTCIADLRSQAKRRALILQ